MILLNVALWWTGIVTWVVLGTFGAFWILDMTLERIIRQFNFRKEFMAFAVARIKARMKP